MSRRTRTLGFLTLSAGAGVISGLVFLAAAELTALAIARESSPLLAVGSFVIDIVPRPLKEFAITTFGAYDKVVLLGSLGLAVVVAAALAGIVQYLKPPLGVIALGVAGVLSLAAIVTRAGATPFAFVVPIVGAVAGGFMIHVLIRRLRAWRTASEAPDDRQELAAGAAVAVDDPPVLAGPSAAVGRRRFLLLAGITGAAAVVVGVGARVVSAATSSIDAARKALRLPKPGTTVTIPPGADLGIPGLSPLITPNADFYRVDTALTVPAVDPGTWRLAVTGMVDSPVQLTFDDLVGMGVDEYAITMTCVSNEVGGPLLGNAIWLGVPVRDVLAKAGVRPGADMVLSRSVDGFTAGTPLESLTDAGLDAILAVGMNGEPLPLEHGFPVRMVVPGLYGYVSATKWLSELKVTTFAADQAYWTPRGYSAKAPIKLSSRVDTPRSGNPVPAGTVPIAGVAWAQTVGIDRVEVSIDDAAWQPAMLSAPLNTDTWVQWHLDWNATPGVHYVAVRATDKNGKLQIQERAPIAPDGSSGWQRQLITVT